VESCGLSPIRGRRDLSLHPDYRAVTPTIHRLKLGPFFRASERERPDSRPVNAASRTLPHHTVLPLCTFSKSVTLLLCDTTYLNSATLAPKRSLMAIRRDFVDTKAYSR
jgi:hypothetical protein